MKDIKTILFALDFSEVSEYAFSYAATFAKTFRADLAVIHVVPQQTDLRDFYVPYMSFDEIDKQVEEGANKMMTDFCAKHKDEFPDMKSFVVTGTPHEKIVDKAFEQNVSMIIMGTHGRQGFEHFIFGSTAEGVVKNAPCPVLTVRPPHHQ